MPLTWTGPFPAMRGPNRSPILAYPRTHVLLLTPLLLSLSCGGAVSLRNDGGADADADVGDMSDGGAVRDGADLDSRQSSTPDSGMMCLGRNGNVNYASDGGCLGATALAVCGNDDYEADCVCPQEHAGICLCRINGHGRLRLQYLRRRRLVVVGLLPLTGGWSGQVLARIGTVIRPPARTRATSGPSRPSPGRPA